MTSWQGRDPFWKNPCKHVPLSGLARSRQTQSSAPNPLHPKKPKNSRDSKKSIFTLTTMLKCAPKSVWQGGGPFWRDPCKRFPLSGLARPRQTQSSTPNPLHPQKTQKFQGLKNCIFTLTTMLKCAPKSAWQGGGPFWRGPCKRFPSST